MADPCFDFRELQRAGQLGNLTVASYNNIYTTADDIREHLIGHYIDVWASAESQYGKVALRRLENVWELILSLSISPNIIERGTWDQPKPKPPPSKATLQSEPPSPEAAQLDNPPGPNPHDYIPPQLKKLHRSLYHNDLVLVLDVPFTMQQALTVLVVPHFDEAMKKADIQSPLKLNEGTPLLLNKETVSDLDSLAMIGLEVACSLRVSHHPLVIDKFLAVRQWSFHEGESVCMWRGDWRGQITTGTACSVEAVQTHQVNNGNKKPKVEELRFLSWGLHKTWKVGQYVQHYTRAEGFVLACENDKVFFWKGGEEIGATPYIAHCNSLQEIQKTRGVAQILERRREDVLAEAEKLTRVSRGNIFRTTSLVEDPNALDPQLVTSEQINKALNII
ncbi:hypothetical protein AAF712_014086 [Marasmius tenuissimus]|uniref:Uncharacterized protein n=1 Tax=Marasmius tenuissimus TaxID=585030 RepID=A0ABR2ZBZ5_9AGAR